MPERMRTSRTYAATSASDRAPPATDSTVVRQTVVDLVSAAITVRRRSTMSFAVEVNATSQNPRRAAEMANAMVNLFMEYQFESRFETAQRARALIPSPALTISIMASVSCTSL